MIDADGRIWFLEVNVAPGLTETSTVLYPMRGVSDLATHRGHDSIHIDAHAFE